VVVLVVDPAPLERLSPIIVPHYCGRSHPVQLIY